MGLIIRLLLTAAAFVFILPLIQGIDFHGNYGAALVLSLVFGLMLWLVELSAVALSAVVTVSSLGLSLLWLIPLWILCFWLLPAFALMLTADVMPQYLSISGFGPAAIAGIVMLLIGSLTSGIYRQPRTAE